MRREVHVLTIRLWIETAERLTGLPRNALFAPLLIGLGFALALFARSLVVRFARELARLMTGRGQTDVPEANLISERLSKWLGNGAFWVVMLLTLLTATEQLGPPVFTSWFAPIAAYLPRILISLVLILIGALIGALARSTITRALPTTDHIDPERFGRIVQALVLGMSGLLAAQQLGLDIAFITTLATIALAGFFGASALAFGFGGRATVANILAGHYVRELYEVGHTVRVAGMEGRIVRMTPTAVILSTQDGETAVPTHMFVETTSTRVTPGGHL